MGAPLHEFWNISPSFQHDRRTASPSIFVFGYWLFQADENAGKIEWLGFFFCRFFVELEKINHSVQGRSWTFSAN